MCGPREVLIERLATVLLLTGPSISIHPLPFSPHVMRGTFVTRSNSQSSPVSSEEEKEKKKERERDEEKETGLGELRRISVYTEINFLWKVAKVSR